MSDFVKTVETNKIKPGTMMTVEASGKEVLIANVDGEFYAMGALCTHEQWDLSEGTLKGTSVTCAGHGSVWDIRTGKGVFEETLEDEPIYDVKVEGGFILVSAK